MIFRMFILLTLVCMNLLAAEDQLAFMKDPKAYKEMQDQVHKQLKEEILSNISIMRHDYKEINQYLNTIRPNIITQEVEFEEIKDGNTSKIKPRQIYFVWGYNRAFHSNADMTFHTEDGSFTVHNAQGVDRPSPFDFDTYFNPAKLSIPQYIVKVGYMFNESWGIEFGQDHMKWVFVNDIPYDVSGNFDATVYAVEEGQEYPTAMNWDDVQNSGNMTWLGAEHTDGYNYVNLSAVYNLNVIKTKNEVFSLDIRPNAGIGIMVPKTRVFMHRDEMWSWKGLDNRFHVAGFGAHVEAKVRATFFKYFFVEAAMRVTHIKITDALVDGSGARMEHAPITSRQFYGSAGFNIPINGRKKKKKKRGPRFL